ncbi:MAG: hypothetical protein MZW92_08885 [Comamonadaceae bacterium]|nr:hypothetical protein [Comamonadaceae bacterium]
MPKAEQRREIRTVPGRHRAGRGRSGATLASARDPRPETAHRATFPKPQAEPSGRPCSGRAASHVPGPRVGPASSRASSAASANGSRLTRTTSARGGRGRRWPRARLQIAP